MINKRASYIGFCPNIARAKTGVFFLEGAIQGAAPDEAFELGVFESDWEGRAQCSLPLTAPLPTNQPISTAISNFR